MDFGFRMPFGGTWVGGVDAPGGARVFPTGGDGDLRARDVIDKAFETPPDTLREAGLLNHSGKIVIAENGTQIGSRASGTWINLTTGMGHGDMATFPMPPG